jgi:hypothetical protein
MGFQGEMLAFGQRGKTGFVTGTVNWLFIQVNKADLAKLAI